MSERVARLLLRGYPSEFREAFGSDMRQLIEDRWRDEHGAWQRVRLCVDLAADLLTTQWRARRQRQPLPHAGGGAAVLFHAFEREARGGTMLPGMVLSLVVVMVFVRVITPQGDRDLNALLQIVSEVLRAL